MGVFRFKPGDWIATAGHGWPFEPVYAGIRAYARAKYQPTPDNPSPVSRLTHVRVVLAPLTFFEMTLPVGRVRTFADDHLVEKWRGGDVMACRFAEGSIDPERLSRAIRPWVGRVYDVGDLADFALSGLGGIFNSVLRHFGDKAGRFAVCSTCAAHVTRQAGIGIDWPVSADSIDPNGPWNKFGRPIAESMNAPWNPIDITHLLTKESFT